MSIFGSIMDKIFHHPAAAAANPAEAPAGAAPTSAEPSTVAPDSIPAATAPAVVPPAEAAKPDTVDVGAVLTSIAAQKGGGGNYQTSIVDLLKLLDLDSSLDARKHLAQEIDVHAGADGSAEQNTALHKAVVQKLAENGGKVPASMKG